MIHKFLQVGVKSINLDIIALRYLLSRIYFHVLAPTSGLELYKIIKLLNFNQWSNSNT